jgi:hypothetical protein
MITSGIAATHAQRLLRSAAHVLVRSATARVVTCVPRDNDDGDEIL